MTCNERWVWQAGSGNLRELTAYVYNTEVLLGMSGRYAPPTTINRVVVPDTAGQVTQSLRHDIRTLSMPLHLTAPDYASFTVAAAALARDLDPMQGMGTLQLIRMPSGIPSDLHCRQVAQIDTAKVAGTGPYSMFPVLSFVADDPYWYGQAQTLAGPAAALGSWFPGIPWAIGAGTVLGGGVVTFWVDVPVWPVWTITGPGINPVITNLTTGQVFSFSCTLLSGQQITIDTTPGVKTVIGPTGANWFSKLVDRSLWAFVAGNNSFMTTMSGATNVSNISALYRPKSLAP